MAGKRETLGDNVLPVRYFLTFEPNLKTFKYSAEAVIKVKIAKRTRQISLNAKELVLKSASVNKGSRSLKAKIRLDDKLERAVLSLDDYVSGDAEIAISFEGVHTDKMYGFYRSRYMENGKEKYLLSSQFEATNARNAFPCFDEPAFKARFNVTMIVGKDYECLSNTPISSSKLLPDGRKRVTFEETPIMSSYLLYLGVGNYDYLESKPGRYLIRVVTPKGRKKLAYIALEYSKKIMDFFEGYFGIKYPLSKLDLIAVPDFAAGAMENWGAITFRDVGLLGDSNASVRARQRIAEYLAHEMAHQWFGDLVTMEWWDDLWLNESFATFMSYKALDHVFPEWKPHLEYVDDVVGSAMAADQFKNTHAVNMEVLSPSQIEEVFAVAEIVYNKGGSVLNMIEDYVGADLFRKGLSIYLKKHAYSNATKSDLWNAIDLAARRSGNRTDVGGIANAWIEKIGYPMVDVVVKGGRAAIEQKRFTMLKNSSKELWPIPISYVDSESMDEKRTVLRKKKGEIRLAGDWVKLNYGQSGLYRVNYQRNIREVLGRMIEKGDLGGVDAWGVENDLFSMVRSARADVEDYIRFVDDYCFKVDYPTNLQILGHLEGLFNLLYKNEELEERVRELMKEYSMEILEKLGWEWRSNEMVFETTLRTAAIVASGRAGEETTIEKARRMFADFNKGKIEINQNIRGAIYALEAWNGDMKTFETLRQRYRKEEIPEEKIRLLGTMGRFRDRKIIKKALDYSMSDEVRRQDSYMIPAILSANPIGKELLFDWTKKNWQRLMKKHQLGTHMLDRYIENLGGLSDMKKAKEIEAFFKRKENWREDLGETLRRTIEMIEINAQFMKHVSH